MPADTLSPSTHHRRLVRAIEPAQTWDGQPLAAWRRKLRRSVGELTGFHRIDAQERCPLRVKRLWRREHELGTIEKIRFTAEPGCDATAFVCLPRGATGELPWMICLQGHTTGAHYSIGVERDDNEVAMAEVPGDRDFGLQCLERGIAAVCLEQRCFGDRREQAQDRRGGNGCHDNAMQALLLGRTMIGERVFDVDRVLDWLWTRDDVDRARVGVMGNSGGGTTSLFAAALLERVAFAMPSCYFCTFQASIMSIHHCCDNYVPGLLQEAEMADVLGTFAPKPVVIVAGKEDEIFPIAATRKAFKQLQAIYHAAGAGDRIELVVGAGGHRFYAEQGWKAARRLFGI